jgi:hypothetical protein
VRMSSSSVCVVVFVIAAGGVDEEEHGKLRRVLFIGVFLPSFNKVWRVEIPE